jgi:hypothetical protein
VQSILKGNGTGSSLLVYITPVMKAHYIKINTGIIAKRKLNNFCIKIRGGVDIFCEKPIFQFFFHKASNYLIDSNLQGYSSGGRQ